MRFFADPPEEGATGAAHVTQEMLPHQVEIARNLLNEIQNRLQFLMDVGLHYLTLDRPAPTLSGGEMERIRLASQLGSGLTRCNLYPGRTQYRVAPARSGTIIKSSRAPSRSRKQCIGS